MMRSFLSSLAQKETKNQNPKTNAVSGFWFLVSGFSVFHMSSRRGQTLIEAVIATGLIVTFIVCCEGQVVVLSIELLKHNPLAGEKVPCALLKSIDRYSCAVPSVELFVCVPRGPRKLRESGCLDCVCHRGPVRSGHRCSFG